MKYIASFIIFCCVPAVFQSNITQHISLIMGMIVSRKECFALLMTKLEKSVMPIPKG